MKNKIIICLILTLKTFACLAQFDAAKLEDAVRYTNVSYQIFDKNIKIQGKLKSIKEVKNNTVLELLESLASEDSEEWGKINYDSSFHKNDPFILTFNKTLKKDIECGYLEPIMVIYFTDKQKKYAIIKYHMVVVDTVAHKFPISDSFIFEKTKWKVAQTFNFQDLIFGNLGSEVLAALIDGKPQQNEKINKLVQQTRNEKNGLDLIKLTNIFNTWEKNSEIYEFFREKIINKITNK